ncbi:MAG: FIST N-terminal domain-containing protein [Thermodesulfobacteriota bacterium]
MLIDTLRYNVDGWALINREINSSQDASAVFLFGDSDVLRTKESFDALRQLYPNAHIVGASSSGNILKAEISTDPVVAVAVHLKNGSIRISKADISSGHDIETLSLEMVNQLSQDDLKHVFVMSDGLNVNGSELIRGLNRAEGSFTISGGMAGDGDRFQETWIVADEPARQNMIVAVGFYGEGLTISTGCYAGWSAFGPYRLVTKSSGNVLFELDGQPALKLYKEYLGEFADGLPLSGMRFPLSIKSDGEADEVIRTLLAIDEDQESITFAGDIPEGYTARLMKPDLDILIDGAGIAAKDIVQVKDRRGLGLIVSCVGRRVVMHDLIEEELEIIDRVLGKDVQLAGFYSYGEIAPFRNEPANCRLHNQTMTLTTLYED